MENHEFFPQVHAKSARFFLLVRGLIHVLLSHLPIHLISLVARINLETKLYRIAPFRTYAYWSLRVI